jgi:hypothetical protein
MDMFSRTNSIYILYYNTHPNNENSIERQYKLYLKGLYRIAKVGFSKRLDTVGRQEARIRINFKALKGSSNLPKVHVWRVFIILRMILADFK